MFKRILVAVDGSDTALRALDVAAELAKDQACDLTICTAVDITRACASMTFATPELVQEYIDALNSDARAQNQTAVDRAQNYTTAAHGIVIDAYAPDGIIEAGKTANADLIVIGSHGRTGMRRALLGSVAEAVMRIATVPVMVVR